MRETFSLDGESCEDYGIRLQRPVSFSGAAVKAQTYSIPGRNGDLHISEGSYENAIGTADCFCLSENVGSVVEKAANWLMGTPGYRRLEVSDDPGTFRLARIVVSPNREFRAGLLAPFSLEFDCDPRRFLIDGEYPVSVSSTPNGIANPTGQNALPLVTVYGTAPGTVTINDTAVEIKELTDQIILDCETMNAYRQPAEGGKENKNNVIYAPTFPTLKPGDNVISWTGGITKIEIIPRWWTL